MNKLVKFLAGVAAGISLGVLFAPKKGKDLRKKLSKSNNKLADFGQTLLEASKDASEEVKRLIETPEVQEMINSGKVKAEEIIDKLKDQSEELSSKAKSELDKLVDNAAKKANATKKQATKKVKKVATASKKRVDKAVKQVKKKISK